MTSTSTATTLPKGEFQNEPFTDFSKPENRKGMEDALRHVKGMFGREYPLIIGGENVTTTEKTKSLNPSHPSEVIAIFQKGTAEMANRAVEAANRAFDRWKRVPAEERVACIYRVGEILRKRRLELNAWLVYEIGKTWAEADADVAELIAFCEYYGREALRLAEPQKLAPMRGEKNYLKYVPLGLGIVIPPWNFAAAIMGGMTIASIITGNTVIVKPSSDSPTIAALFVNILYEAGVPRDVVSFFAGPGATAGEALVTHPKTRFVAFTGSKEAGCVSANWPRKRSRGRCGSSAPFSRWAARMPSSWTMKPTWMPQSKASLLPHSGTRVRNVLHARARSWRKKCTTSSSTSWLTASKK